MLNIPEITARDLMQTELVHLVAEAPVSEAVESFEEYHISGAPVFNSAAEPVGVLSESDIVKLEHLDSDGLRTSSVTNGDDDYDDVTASLRQERVGDWMTPKLVSVPPHCHLSKICKLLVDEQIHRVFVVEGQRLLGVITTFDIVRFVAEQTALAPRKR